MTPHETIQKIIDLAVQDGRLEDAVKVLEDYAEEKHFKFKKWVDKIVVSGNSGDYSGFNDRQLWVIFNQAKNNNNG